MVAQLSAPGALMGGFALMELARHAKLPTSCIQILQLAPLRVSPVRLGMNAVVAMQAHAPPGRTLVQVLRAVHSASRAQSHQSVPPMSAPTVKPARHQIMPETAALDVHQANGRLLAPIHVQPAVQAGLVQVASHGCLWETTSNSMPTSGAIQAPTAGLHCFYTASTP